MVVVNTETLQAMEREKMCLKRNFIMFIKGSTLGKGGTIAGLNPGLDAIQSS